MKGGEGKEGWDSDKRLKKRSGAGNEGQGLVGFVISGMMSFNWDTIDLKFSIIVYPQPLGSDCYTEGSSKPIDDLSRPFSMIVLGRQGGQDM